MIIYFSATGNSEHVAKQIARRTEDKAVSMTESGTTISLKEGERFGIVTPTYFWGLPSYVEEFLNTVTIQKGKNAYIYCVATYGGTIGQTDYYANKILKKKGLRLSASYGIKTVDNWTVWFDVNDKKEVETLLRKEAEQTEETINAVQEKREVFISKDKKSLFMCSGARYFYEKARKTKHLRVNEKCIACGLCARECPTKAIEMLDGKPQWVKDKCAMCFRCLHRCPTFAIQYEDKTEGHGQYTHPKE